MTDSADMQSARTATILESLGVKENLPMIDWDGLREQIRQFVDYLSDLLDKQPPNWDSTEFADAVIVRLQKAFEADPSLEKKTEFLSSNTLAFVRLEMADRLDWEAIRCKLCTHVINRWGLPLADAEDLASSSTATAWQEWNPFSEKHWSQPGLALARGILANLLREHFRNIKKRKRVEDNLASKANLASEDNFASKFLQLEEGEQIDEQELVKLIDKWLDDNLDVFTGTICRIDMWYGVSKELCGIIARPRRRSAKGARAHWHRKFSAIQEQLLGHLQKNRSEFVRKQEKRNERG